MNKRTIIICIAAIILLCIASSDWKRLHYIYERSIGQTINQLFSENESKSHLCGSKPVEPPG